MRSLWGPWLFPLAILVYRSGFLPRFPYAGVVLSYWTGPKFGSLQKSPMK